MSTKNLVVDKSPTDYAGAGVLITRPMGQGEALRELVLAQGAKPYTFPTLEIIYTSVAKINHQLAGLQSQDIIIFISVNAVNGVLRKINDELYQRLLQCKIAAIGNRTQSALANYKLLVTITPDPKHQHSEGLLQHHALSDLSDKQVFIVRAQKGRNILRDSLQTRGAKVEYVQAYRRNTPVDYNARPIIKALQNKQIKFTLLTSFDAYLNLRQMLGRPSKHLLKQTCLVVPSERIARKIKHKDDFDLLIASNASDQAMLAATLRTSK